REPVDLRLCHEVQHIVLQPEEAADAGTKLVEIRLGEGIVEAEHRYAMAHLGKALGRGGTDLAARAVRAAQFGGAALEGAVAADQGVVFGVADLGGVALVIGAVVVCDLGREARQFLGGFFIGKLVDGAVRQSVVHSSPPVSKLSAAARAASVTRSPA